MSPTANHALDVLGLVATTGGIELPLDHTLMVPEEHRRAYQGVIPLSIAIVEGESKYIAFYCGTIELMRMSRTQFLQFSKQYWRALEDQCKQQLRQQEAFRKIVGHHMHALGITVRLS